MNDPRSHETIFSDLAGYALDALDDDARRRVEEHLAECDECTSEIAELLEGAGNLAFAVPSVSPPEDLQDRIRAAIEREPTPVARETSVDFAPVPEISPDISGLVPARAPWYASPRLAWAISSGIAAAFVGVVAIAAVVTLQLNDRVDELTNQVAVQERDVKTVSASLSAMDRKVEQQTLNEVQQVSVLQEAADTLEQQVNDLRWLQYVTSTGDWNTPSFFSGGLQPQAPQGMLVTHSSGEEALLMVNGLAPAPTGSVYQVWLIYEGSEVPGSTFTVDRNGYAVVTLDLLGDANDYIGASVTVEPAGGSQTSSDFIVLIGTSQ